MQSPANVTEPDVLWATAKFLERRFSGAALPFGLSSRTAHIRLPALLRSRIGDSPIETGLDYPASSSTRGTQRNTQDAAKYGQAGIDGNPRCILSRHNGHHARLPFRTPHGRSFVKRGFPSFWDASILLQVL